MQNSPLVSVVMPVYNAMPYLQEAVGSILAQTHTNLELLAIDDGSTDDSQKYLASLTDPRLRLICHPTNKGQAATRNTGMNAARGKYIAFMDADDISLPYRLEKQVALMESNPKLGLCGCGVETFGARNSTFTPPTSPFLIKNLIVFFYVIATHTALFRKDIDYEEQPNFGYGEDLLFTDNMIIKYPASNVKEILYRYRIHSQSVSHQVNQLSWNQKLYKELIKQRIGFTPTDEQVNAHLAWLPGSAMNITTSIIPFFAYFVCVLRKGGYSIIEKCVLTVWVLASVASRAIKKLMKHLRARLSR